LAHLALLSERWVYGRVRAIRLAIASNYSARSQIFCAAWNKAAHFKSLMPESGSLLRVLSSPAGYQGGWEGRCTGF
jgi:hypothetical protein